VKTLNWGTANRGSTAHSTSLHFQVIGTTLHILQYSYPLTDYTSQQQYGNIRKLTLKMDTDIITSNLDT
jgi:hypothetical protein